MSLLNLIPEPPGKITAGSILFKGENLLQYSKKQMRKVRGKEISMIFQDPMTALNPVDTVGEQIARSFTCTRMSAKRNRGGWQGR